MQENHLNFAHNLRLAAYHSILPDLQIFQLTMSDDAVLEQAKKAIPAEIRMYSGCRDAETSAVRAREWQLCRKVSQSHVVAVTLLRMSQTSLASSSRTLRDVRGEHALLLC
jgi:hypothetical protein